jgi:chromosome partitioning protein
MSILVVLSLKGGVGKTLSALYLAAVTAETGRSVTLLDADEEGSAVRWAAHTTLPFRVVAARRDRLAQESRALEARGELVIVDTPPNSREVLVRAAMLASQVLVPVIPTGLDVDRLLPTLELLRDIEATRGTLDVAIFFTRWVERRRLAREAQAALAGYPVLAARIRALARYEESFGSVPTYLDEYRAVWKELEP